MTYEPNGIVSTPLGLSFPCNEEHDENPDFKRNKK